MTKGKASFMAARIHVISPAVGAGNCIDLQLVASLLRDNGFDVTEYPVHRRNRRALYGRVLRHVLSLRGRFDANLFLGPLFPEWLGLGRKNIWMPNPEGFNEQHRRHLPRIDHILAKTRLTEKLFSALGRPVSHTGFTSRDHFDASVERDSTQFFHTRSSIFKGTVRLLETWKAHPDWPRLVAVISDENVLPGFAAPNVEIVRRYITDDELRQMQNKFVFHLCCSEAEGFGHYIMEPMSCGGVVFTTNGPPMNELVHSDRGILVDHLPQTKPCGLSQRYFFDPQSLEREVQRAQQLDDVTRRQLGAAARAFYLQNGQDFRSRFLDVMRSLVPGD